MSIDRKMLVFLSAIMVLLAVSGMYYTLTLVTDFSLTLFQFTWTTVLTIGFALVAGAAMTFLLSTLRSRDTKVTITRESGKENE